MEVTALREVQELLGGEKFPLCESPSLRLEKFVRIGDNTKKREEIDAAVRCQRTYGREIPRFLPKGAEQFVARLESRLIVNQAGGILENAGLCLHPHFGTPYIPGSAVKGIARHAAWCEWNEETDETRKAAIAVRLAETFGYPTGDRGLDEYLAKRGWKDRRSSGSVAFLPAVPVGKAVIATDIVNCHHKDYYAGKKEKATDDESPNPQFFPAVESGESFVFTLAPVRSQSRLPDAKAWLTTAVTCLGSGAKTAAGYGWFSYSEEESRKYFAKLVETEQRERLKSELTALSERLRSIQAEFPSGSVLPPETVAAVRRSDADLREKFKGMEEAKSLQDLVNVLMRQIPQESPLERLRGEWSSAPNLKAILNSDDLQRFENRPDNRKRNIVTLLRETTGRGAEIWAAIKAAPKKFAKIEQAVRSYCKSQPGTFTATGSVKQGKMP